MSMCELQPIETWRQWFRKVHFEQTRITGFGFYRAPALRDRPSDIPFSSRTFFNASNCGRGTLKFDRIALASLVQHNWPGNVRELENVVHSVALFRWRHHWISRIG